MDEQQFIARKQADWARLTAILELSRSRTLRAIDRRAVRDLGPLYRRAASDLSFARTAGFRPELIQRLNAMVASAFGLLYRTDNKSWPGLRSYILVTVPNAFRAHIQYFGAALALTVLGAVLAYALVMMDLRNKAIFFPPGSMFEGSIGYWEKGATSSGKPDAEAAMMTSFYIANNTQVSFTAFAVGIVGCVITAYLLLQNGMVVGALTAIVARSGHLDAYWPALLPHGVVEISAILISAAAGLSMGWAFLCPGRKARGRAIADAARESLPMVMITIILLLFAAFTEGFISHSSIPRALKYVYGIGSGIALYAYLGWSGKGIKEFNSRKAFQQ